MRYLFLFLLIISSPGFADEHTAKYLRLSAPLYREQAYPASVRRPHTTPEPVRDRVQPVSSIISPVVNSR